MEATITYNFEADMTCGGCSGAITRILGKNDKLSNIVCNLETKTFTVQSS